MEDKSAVLAEVCAALTGNQSAVAADILRDRYPFVPLVNVGRRYSVRQAHNVFVRDGFVDRYSGTRLVFPATLRLISKRLPEQFPFHRNGRFDLCHFGFWELFPTIDHLVPVARGGADDQANWITTSMVRNAAKGVLTLGELGWSLWPPGDVHAWDGLAGWFVEQATADRTILDDVYFRQWFAAATQPRPLLPCELGPCSPGAH
jgi:hypothetical protein